MKIVVTGKQIDVGDALRGRAEESISEIAEKYFSNPIDATVTLSRDGALIKADIAVHVGREIQVHGHASAADAHAAYDQAAERIDKRLRRFKRRLRDHHHRDAPADMPGEPLEVRHTVLAGADAGNGGDDAEWHPIVVADLETGIDSLTVEEAVMRLELADAAALMFRNRAHGGLNTVYRRRDGNIGWIDPNGQSKTTG